MAKVIALRGKRTVSLKPAHARGITITLRGVAFRVKPSRKSRAY